MGALSYLMGPLVCPACGTEFSDGLDLSISNQLSASPEGEVFRVGEPVDVAPGDFEAAFLVLRLPAAGEDVHVLHEWWCLACGSLNWAEAVFGAGRFLSFDPVAFTRATMERIHFVGGGLLDYYSQITDRSIASSPASPGDVVREILAVTAAAT